MQSIDTILEQYRNADLHVRLNLYLLHRDLRKDFIAIDRVALYGNTQKCNREEEGALKTLRLCHCS
jgi:hypothetical protein